MYLAAQTNKQSYKVNSELSGTFDQLSVKGSITLYLLQGDEPSLLIHGKKRIVKQVKTSINNRILSISKNYSLNDERVNVYLTVTNLVRINTSGNVIIETPTNI